MDPVPARSLYVVIELRQTQRGDRFSQPRELERGAAEPRRVEAGPYGPRTLTTCGDADAWIERLHRGAELRGRHGAYGLLPKASRMSSSPQSARSSARLTAARAVL